jgi:pimeloyl-ACP methyl ester carboxylesterase
MRRHVNRGVLVWCVVALGALALAATVLFLLEMFPQAPVKPLSALAPAPTRQGLVLDSVNGPLVGDLFVPGSRLFAPPRRPAVIIGTGVRLDREQDRAAIRNLAASLARLGYVALWPRLEAIDGGAWQFERPETFVRAFQYLAERSDVDPERISLVGISLGASITLLAAADPAIAGRVHALVFLGGYFDLVDYILAIADEQAIEDGRTIPWRPGDDTRRQARELVEAEGVPQLRPYLEPDTALGSREALLALLAPDEVARLQRFSPAAHIARVRAPVFILHDRHDEYVPFTESQKLARVLPPATPRSVLISSAFDHVNLGQDVALETIAEYAALYRFLIGVFAALAA